MTAFFAPILSLIGVFVGWGLTQLTNYFNIYLNDRRTLRETLYFLLEMQHQIETIKSIDEGANSYLQTLNLSIPNFTSSQEEYDQVLHVFRKMIIDFHNPRIQIELQELNESYDNCLLKLASVDPISAFRLKGKNKIISYLNQWNNYASETILSNLNVNADPKAIELSNELIPQVENGLINETF